MYKAGESSLSKTASLSDRVKPTPERGSVSIHLDNDESLLTCTSENKGYQQRIKELSDAVRFVNAKLAPMERAMAGVTEGIADAKARVTHEMGSTNLWRGKDERSVPNVDDDDEIVALEERHTVHRPRANGLQDD
jgi:hypothetical protein